MSQFATPEIWITGAAAITALGDDLESTWSAMLAGRTAGRWVELYTLAGQVVRVPAAPVDSPLLAGVRLESSSLRADRLALEVARQVVCQARLETRHQRQAVIAFGSSKPALSPWFVRTALERKYPDAPAGVEGVDPADYPTSPGWDMLTPQRAAVRVAQALKVDGPVLSSVSACSTGLHSLIRAVQWIQDGHGPIAIAGAVESGLNALFASAFLRMRVLAGGCADAAAACKPFDLHRSGFVLGEGAAAVVIESAGHARARGARPLAMICGYCRGADPTGLADMDPHGRPLAGVIRRCLAGARVRPAEVCAIKAHGTATQQNDRAESAAIRAVFGDENPAVISLKGHLGHTLGASGAIETAVCAKAAATGMMPATANLTLPDPQCAVNHPARPIHVFSHTRPYMLCLSAGFGGHLAAILIRSSRCTCGG